MTRHVAVGLGFALLCFLGQSARGENATVIAGAWKDYSPQEKQDAMRNYRRYLEAPPAKRREIERQFQRWQQMPAEEQQRIRKNYDRYLKMPKEERKEFNRKFEEWKKDQDR